MIAVVHHRLLRVAELVTVSINDLHQAVGETVVELEADAGELHELDRAVEIIRHHQEVLDRAVLVHFLVKPLIAVFHQTRQQCRILDSELLAPGFVPRVLIFEDTNSVVIHAFNHVADNVLEALFALNLIEEWLVADFTAEGFNAFHEFEEDRCPRSHFLHGDEDFVFGLVEERFRDTHVAMHVFDRATQVPLGAVGEELEVLAHLVLQEFALLVILNDFRMRAGKFGVCHELCHYLIDKACHLFVAAKLLEKCLLLRGSRRLHFHSRFGKF